MTFPGFTIPLYLIDIGLPVSLTIPGFTIPGGTLIPTLPLGLALSNGIPPVDIPAIVLDRILLDLHADTTIGPINVPIAGFGGVPGFGNSTTLPSSGFFNTGAGGGSGFSNTGAGMSGLLNAMSDPLLGSASGFANFGTQLSGILNRGAGISGVYNTGALVSSPRPSSRVSATSASSCRACPHSALGLSQISSKCTPVVTPCVWRNSGAGATAR